VCAPPGDDVRHAAGPGPHSFEHWSAIDSRFLHHQAADVRGPQIFGVAEGTFDQLLDHPRAALRLIPQNREGVVDRFPTNQIG
jgi:hypothetical protein